MVYAKKINSRQRKALKTMEGLTGLEPMYQDELDSKEMTFDQMWSANISHHENILADVVNIDLNGC